MRMVGEIHYFFFLSLMILISATEQPIESAHHRQRRGSDMSVVSAYIGAAFRSQICESSYCWSNLNVRCDAETQAIEIIHN